MGVLGHVHGQVVLALTRPASLGAFEQAEDSARAPLERARHRALRVVPPQRGPVPEEAIPRGARWYSGLIRSRTAISSEIKIISKRGGAFARSSAASESSFTAFSIAAS